MDIFLGYLLLFATFDVLYFVVMVCRLCRFIELTAFFEHENLTI